jgi:hypothetical protein
MEHYGHKCNWPDCNVTEIQFLTADHINNDGARHRKSNVKINGSGIYYWLVKNNFPPGFQILCWNHQHLKKLEHTKHKLKPAKRAAGNRDCCHNSRLKVINHYGGHCNCCGQSNIDLLVLHHIYGGGTKQRKKFNIKNLYRWLIKNNFPLGFGVLCHNCNNGSAINGGVCPHNG